MLELRQPLCFIASGGGDGLPLRFWLFALRVSQVIHNKCHNLYHTPQACQFRFESAHRATPCHFLRGVLSQVTRRATHCPLPLALSSHSRSIRYKSHIKHPKPKAMDSNHQPPIPSAPADGTSIPHQIPPIPIQTTLHTPYAFTQHPFPNHFPTIKLFYQIYICFL